MRRVISSVSFQPTSPTHTSFVPGRKTNRNGFRIPYATIRRAFAFVLEASGFPAAPAPVAGLRRRSAPFKSTGSPAGRRTLCERSAPPSAVGGFSFPPTPAGGSPHGFFGVGEFGLPPACP